MALAGLDNVRNLVTSASVLKLFDSETKLASELLTHCAQTGLLSRYLGAYFSLPKELLFTCGFMHDIGKLMLLEVHPKEYSSLMESAEGEADASHAAERIAFDFDHAVLGAAVLRKWRIPSPVPDVVEHHHDLAGAQGIAGELAQMVAVVRLAGAIAHDLANDRSEPSEATSKSASTDYLGISEQQLSAMWSDFDSLCNRTRKMVETNKTSWLECQSLVPRDRKQPKIVLVEEDPDPRQEPVTIPCHVCGEASFGEDCPVCNQHVCPKHGGAREGWCDVCAGEYAEVRRASMRTLPQTVGLTVVVATLLVLGLGTLPWAPTGTKQAIGAALIVVLTGMVSGAVHWWRARAGFLRSKRKREKTAATVSNRKWAFPSFGGWLQRQ